MEQLTDIQIAQKCKMLPIIDIAKKVGFKDDEIDLYGKYKAKINAKIEKVLENKKLILVTAINPTPQGEGKTTTTIGLADAMNKIGKKTIVALREPSLGPVFGLKGGATGGGYAQVVPMEDINLHFTGDFHAIELANNLISAVLDNHIHQGNELKIDDKRITWRRAIDMNDRQLRNIMCGLGGTKNGTPREDGFDITVASEIMAVVCLSENLKDLKNKISNITVAYNTSGERVTVEQLKCTGAVCVLLKDAIKPNLCQTLEQTPAIIHGGPFANIAHGCNSIIATKMALSYADYVVTEAGFGADLGAEKFLDIKCRKAKLKPDVCVIVATVRALKYHGGLQKGEIDNHNKEYLKNGLPNLIQHIDNMKNVYGLQTVVAINVFPNDTEEELKFVEDECKKLGVDVCISKVWAEGSEGGLDLARTVSKMCEEKSNFRFAYEDEDSIEQKIEKVCKKIYRAKAVNILPDAKKQIEDLEKLGFANLPICISKTQYSFSDNPKLLAAPKDFEITIRNVKLNSGAGFIVLLTGDILTMPGLPKVPAAEGIDIDENGVITGLF